jgi:hypothetical protein
MLAAIVGAVGFMLCLDAFGRLYDRPMALLGTTIGMVCSIGVMLCA